MTVLVMVGNAMWCCAESGCAKRKPTGMAKVVLPDARRYYNSRERHGNLVHFGELFHPSVLLQNYSDWKIFAQIHAYTRYVLLIPAVVSLLLTSD